MHLYIYNYVESNDVVQLSESHWKMAVGANRKLKIRTFIPNIDFQPSRTFTIAALTNRASLICGQSTGS